MFSALTAVANGFGSLFGYRLGLGIGESAAYPANAKVVSLWFRGRSARWLPASTTVTTGSGPVARGQPRGPRSSGKQPDG